MAGLSIGQLITAAIIVVVVLVSLKAGSGIAHAADRLSDIVGIPLGPPPSIRSFTATPDGNGNMQFQLSLAHSTSDTELLIYRLYTPTPDKDLNKMAPDYKKEENMVFDLLPDTSSESGQKLGEELVNGVINKLCPKDADVTSGKNGCLLSTYGFGGYKFVAVLRKRGESATVDSQDAITGFYDENYVEMLNTPVFGCSDDNFGNCNVTACKKELINKDLLGVSNLLEVRRESGVLRKISDEFRAEKEKEPGFKAESDCGKVGNAPDGKVINDDKDLSANNFVLRGCSDKDIADLNIKMVRARLLEAAFEGSIQSINSEDKYFTGVNQPDKLKERLAQLDLWKDQAVRMTMSCTEPLGGPDPKYHWPNTPFGTYTALTRLNWQFVPTGQTPKIWKDGVNTELNRVLDSLLKPVIIELKAGTNKDNQLELAWKLPVGKDALTQYQLKLFHSSAALNKELKDANKLVLPVAVQQPGKSDDPLFKYPNAGSLTSAQMGAYWFELTAFDSQGESSKVDVHTGMYDNNYIELYRDLKDVADACDDGCNVIGRKEAALSNEKLGMRVRNDPTKTYKDEPTRTYIYIARCGSDPKYYDKFKSTTNCPAVVGKYSDACQMDFLRKQTEFCTNDELSALYKDVVTLYAADLPKEAFPTDIKNTDLLLRIDCNKDGWMDTYSDERYKNPGIIAVCNAKNNLKKSLDRFKWGYTGS